MVCSKFCPGKFLIEAGEDALFFRKIVEISKNPLLMKEGLGVVVLGFRSLIYLIYQLNQSTLNPLITKGDSVDINHNIA
jgi:type IV secretory pathway TrbF-like protein